MANVNAAKGFVNPHMVGGKPYTGALRKVKKEASVAIAIGDAVKSAGSGEAVTGIATVTTAAANERILGIVAGIEYSAAAPTRMQLAAADQDYIYIIDDPEVLFDIQEDSDANNLAVTDIGAGFDIIYAAPSAYTNYSGTMLDSSTAATSGRTLKVLGLAQRVGNAIGTNAVWEVQICEHENRADITLV